MQRSLYLLVVALLLVFGNCFAWQTANAKPFRLIYVESGPFKEYPPIIQGLALGLKKRGLIDNCLVPTSNEMTSVEGMWAWLSENAGGDKVEFLADGFYTANYSHERWAEIPGEILKRIRERKDVDCILSLGSWASKDIAKLDTDVSIIVCGVTNAVAAGIVPSIEDSGKDSLVAVVFPNRVENQVKIFHSIFNFKRMGIAYDDSDSGRNSISLKDIEQATHDLNIELVHCKNIFNIEDVNLSAERLKQCHKQLVQEKVDAVYLTYNLAITKETMPKVLKPILDAKLPTFSQQGGYDVRNGVLMSISDESGDKAEGEFCANLVSKIIDGVMPRKLNQIFNLPIRLDLNIHNASIIGWDPSLEVLVKVDNFYQTDVY